MFFVKILTEPAILIIIAAFIFCILTVLKNYTVVGKNLKSVYEFLQSLEKRELSYRYPQLDEFLTNNSFAATPWEDFKKVLIFPDKLFVASQNAKGGGEYSPEVYSTIDSSYFFNEDSLISENINNKFIQTMPTLLTGLGPFFTFLKMAIAFTEVNFSSGTNVEQSLNGLIGNIQIAALCSVFAVGFSLLFMLIEKVLYNRICKKYYLLIQKEFIRLFDVVPSEKLLLDLVKETKLQNISSEKFLKSLPSDISKALSSSFTETAIPFLENILYSLNKINENINKGSDGDVIDKLF